MQRIEKIKEFDGWLERYTHNSNVCQCEMTFSVYLPPQAKQGSVPSLYWLSGLTCTDDNFRVKAGAQRYAAELGIALIIPDTSPRGEDVPDNPDRYDLGQGAGFYINATQSPWNKNYHMYDYVVSELPNLIETNFPVNELRSITGHSMGGHGALICALKNPWRYRSVSAFAPICHPSICPWGETIFSSYLGSNTTDWHEYDTCELIMNDVPKIPALIDQGTDDEFLLEQLKTQDLKNICEAKEFPMEIRMQEGYDHSYHFIATFIGEHMKFHSDHLK